jgi:hypothetical protein
MAMRLRAYMQGRFTHYFRHVREVPGVTWATKMCQFIRCREKTQPWSAPSSQPSLVGGIVSAPPAQRHDAEAPLQVPHVHRDPARIAV